MKLIALLLTFHYRYANINNVMKNNNSFNSNDDGLDYYFVNLANSNNKSHDYNGDGVITKDETDVALDSIKVIDFKRRKKEMERREYIAEQARYDDLADEDEAFAEFDSINPRSERNMRSKRYNQSKRKRETDSNKLDADKLKKKAKAIVGGIALTAAVLVGGNEFLKDDFTAKQAYTETIDEDGTITLEPVYEVLTEGDTVWNHAVDFAEEYNSEHPNSKQLTPDEAVHYIQKVNDFGEDMGSLKPGQIINMPELTERGLFE
ncbi:MAG: hypothetical protein Q4C83_00775 [Candidatus Saccharibacteria bacterium]|nr:hypothetical protein [Candidatus Saccharibacteria bacterium]